MPKMVVSENNIKNQLVRLKLVRYKIYNYCLFYRLLEINTLIYLPLFSETTIFGIYSTGPLIRRVNSIKNGDIAIQHNQSTISDAGIQRNNLPRFSLYFFPSSIPFLSQICSILYHSLCRRYRS